MQIILVCFISARHCSTQFLNPSRVDETQEEEATKLSEQASHLNGPYVYYFIIYE